MHTLKTKRELEIFEQAYQKGRLDLKKEVRELIDEWDDYVIFEEHFNQL